MTNVPGASGSNPARPVRTHAHETKAFYKTSEFIFYILAVVAVLVASAVVDSDEDGQGFGADHAWQYVTFLTVGYMISRGLSKAGTHHRSDD